MIVGVTGKSGVGKSTYARKYAKEHNLFYLDIDEVGHQILDLPDVQKECAEKLGLEVSSVNRKKLGELVFANRHKMGELAEITWEKMKVLIDSILEENKDIVLDWILLPHSHYFKLCDKKILITLDETKRRERLKKRDNITDKEIDLRDNASIEYSVNDFDIVINGAENEND